MKSEFSDNESTRSGPSKTMWIGLTGIAMLVLAYLVLGPGNFGGSSGRNHPAVGTKLNDLELQPLTAAETPIALKDLRGKVVLMNFWGTWCPPCRVEFPHLIELQNTLSTNETFRLISVSCRGSVVASRGETEGAHVDALRLDTQKFLDQRGVQLTTYADPLGRARSKIGSATKLDGFAFPTTLLLDREGTIRGMWVGFREGDEKEMETLAREVLDETPRE